MVSYEGLFFEGESKNKILELEERHLPIMNDELHCTFVYHPTSKDFYEELIGKEYKVKLVGYACNNKNSGFLIEIPEELIKYYKNIDRDQNKMKKPHITVSISKDSEPYLTKNLNFIPLKTPVEIIGKFGYWIKEEEREYLSYERQI